MPAKRILYIITQAEWGGAQKYVFDLANSLTSAGIEIGVAAGVEKTDLFNELGRLDVDNLRIFRIKNLIRSINPYYDFLSFFSIIKIIRKFKPDIVHLNSSKAGILGTFAVKLNNLYEICVFWNKNKMKVKTVYTAHGFVFNEDLPILIYLFYLWAERIFSLLRDKIIAVSEYDFHSALDRKVVSARKMVVVHNGVDLKCKNNFFPKNEAREKILSLILERKKYLIPADTQIVGTIANLYENKGLKYLVEGASIVTEDNSNCIFVLIGTGKLKDKLGRLIQHRKMVGKFFMLGSLPEAYKYLKAFDVFCLPSIKEGLSYTLIEALMAGVSVVATDVGGNSEVVKEGINGFLVLPKDKNELAEKIKELLKDENLRNRMEKATEDMSSSFSLERMVRETRDVYEKL